MNKKTSISSLLGLVLVSITGMTQGEREVVFTSEDGRKFRMYHDQDCCESVYLEDVCGDPDHLIGRALTFAEVVSNSNHLNETDEGEESFTWTFYKIGTNRGVVTLRWFGSSNGYYSEDVSFEEI